MTHGGKLPEIAKFLAESTGRTFEHQEIYRVIQKLQKRFQGTGEGKPEFQDLQEIPIQGLELQEGATPPSSIAPGLLFQNYDAMRASLDQWSRVNFSPLTKIRSIAAGPGHPRPSHTFWCPHKKAKFRQRQRQSLGIQRQRKITVNYVDCPFLITAKENLDGSCVVTKALTEHSGHEVSEEQFQKYQR